MRPEVPEAPLRDFVRQEGGIPLLLLHASDMSQMPEGLRPSSRTPPSQVEGAGSRHALLGHFHDARTSELVTYPGSPEPLGWTESGRHCTALVTIEDGGALRVELDDVNARQFAQETIDITGMTSEEHVREAVMAVPEGEHPHGAVIRATPVGGRD